MLGDKQFVVVAEYVGDFVAILVQESPRYFSESGNVVQLFAVLLDTGEDGF
ncbi:MAG: hypothetical protein KDD27_10470 [Saprospiraceae bacterium]|nr:hypothetical protein [Saprospiraceae bacterium]